MAGMFAFLRLTAMNMVTAKVKADEIRTTQHSQCLCMPVCMMLALN